MPVILNSVMADDLFADGPAVGQVFELQRFVGASKFVSAATVVGVVGDTRSSAVREPPRPALYHGRTPSLRFGTILVRADASEDVLRRVRGIVRQVDPAVPVATLRPLRDKVIERISEDRVQARLSAIQALLAVLLGAAGIFAVVGQHVSERTRDFGIRSALGASTSQIVRQALRPVIRAAALGSRSWPATLLASVTLAGNLPFRTKGVRWLRRHCLRRRIDRSSPVRSASFSVRGPQNGHRESPQHGVENITLSPPAAPGV